MRRRETTPPVRSVLAWLERTGTRRVREGMVRDAVRPDRAFGVAIGALRDEGLRLRRNHDLAAALWDSGWYEARMLAAFKVTRRAGRKGEFQRRAAFALLWALTVHDRTSPDEPFERGLVLRRVAAKALPRTR